MVNPALSKFFGEPLVQFFILGGIIFVLDTWLASGRDDPNRIVIDDHRVQQLIGIFEEGQGRSPSDNELSNMLVKWTQNEIMYREALKMELDQGDEMMRNRLVLKMHNILFNKAAPANPTDEQLRVFFDTNRTRYDKPAHYDIEQFYVAESLTPEVTALAATLGDAPAPDDYVQGYMEYRHRPQSNIVAMFGEPAAQQMLASEANRWVTVTSSRGVHLARVVRAYPSESADFDDVKSRVARDWKKYHNDFQLAQQTLEIANNYDIEMAVSEPFKQRLSSADTLQQRFREAIENPTKRLNTAAVSQ